MKTTRRSVLRMILLSVGAVVVAACERLVKPTPQILPTIQPLETGTMTPTDLPSQTPKPTASLSPTTTPTPSPCIRLRTPENGEQLSTTGKITFMWEIVAGAAFYELLIMLPSQQPVMFRTEGNRRDQYLEALWLGGRYQWSVTAYDARGEAICLADPFSFEKPELIMPTPTVVQEEDEEPTSDGTGGEGTPSTASGSFSDVSEG